MGGDIHKKWILISFIIVYIQYFIVRINSAGICYQEDCTNNCCNCTVRSKNDSQPIQTQDKIWCNGTCPLGFYLEEEVSCCMDIMKMTTSPYENERNATSFENSTTTISLEKSTTDHTLLTSTPAPLGTILICHKCRKPCLSCEGSAENCTECQPGFELKEGGKCSAKTSDSGTQLPIIIGASVGGGLALILATVIIVFCVCRCKRRKARENDSTRMSEILQGRTGGAEKRDDDVTDSPSPNPIYENVGRSNELGTQIQEQGDKILRYARDPTKMDKKKEPIQPDPARSSSYYENSATIRRQDKIQDLSEELVINQLGKAPSPPSVQKKKSKKSLKSRVSKKLKRLTGNTTPQVSPNEEPQEEHYLPMGLTNTQPEPAADKETSQDNQEVYEEMEENHHSSSLYPQEDYANLQGASADVPSEPAPLPPPIEQEDYENIKDRFPVPKRARTGQKSKAKMRDPPPEARMPDPPPEARMPDPPPEARMPDPPPEAKINQASQGTEDDKLSKDYINVQKFRRSEPKSSKKDDLTSQDAQGEMENYENIKFRSKKK